MMVLLVASETFQERSVPLDIEVGTLREYRHLIVLSLMGSVLALQAEYFDRIGGVPETFEAIRALTPRGAASSHRVGPFLGRREDVFVET
ncbi:hypothetical protein ABZW96_37390 [Nocardia sp. NPDC004168]|uniref:hypothetical protein n=1 Tax=Nocardia sp. NPDC004168 TaxID=3154452 RepID=UPI0033A21086